MEIEQHPLEPFLPGNARLLMLGSFPPQRKRWSMEFYYPNWNNDMWRIAGLLFFNDKDHFADKSQKAFRKERIIDFLNEKGIALFDTATAVRRLQDNASDKYLEVVRPTDISALLQQLPQCKAIVTTGQKATDTLCTLFSLQENTGVAQLVEHRSPKPGVGSSSLSSRAMIRPCKFKKLQGLILFLSACASASSAAISDAASRKPQFPQYCCKNRVAGKSVRQEAIHIRQYPVLRTLPSPHPYGKCTILHLAWASKSPSLYYPARNAYRSFRYRHTSPSGAGSPQIHGQSRAKALRPSVSPSPQDISPLPPKFPHRTSTHPLRAVYRKKNISGCNRRNAQKQPEYPYESPLLASCKIFR